MESSTHRVVLKSGFEEGMVLRGLWDRGLACIYQGLRMTELRRVERSIDNNQGKAARHDNGDGRMVYLYPLTTKRASSPGYCNNNRQSNNHTAYQQPQAKTENRYLTTPRSI